MSVDDANERLIAALCELHNAEIEFIVSRMAHLAEHNPDASIAETAAKGPEIEEELREFKDSIQEIIEEEVTARRRRDQDPEEIREYPEGSIERMVSDILDELEG